MVLGANLGSALNPLLEAGGDRADVARLRVPAGNLLKRVAGTLLGRDHRVPQSCQAVSSDVLMPPGPSSSPARHRW
jgi:hypothetical protein